MAELAPRDPFAPTADPRAYVPRRSTDRVLAWLASEVRRNAGAVVLTGPPGSGKTLLLRVLESRLGEEIEPLHVPYPLLPPAEMWTWLGAALGIPASHEPRAAFERAIRQRRAAGRPLLVAVDSAESLPIATAEQLGAVAAASGGSLRLALALHDGKSARAVVAALGQPATVVHLHDDMSEQEARDYVAARLARVAVPSDLRERFGPETIARIYRDSHGNPARLHELAIAVLRGRDATAQPERDPRQAESESNAPPGRARRHLRLVPRWGSQDDRSSEVAEHVIEPVEARSQLPPASEPAVEMSPPAEALASPAARQVSAADAARGAAQARIQMIGLAGAALASGFALALWLRAPAEATPQREARAVLAPPTQPQPPVAIPEPVAVGINAYPWAEVEIDGEPRGQTPLGDLLLVPGTHQVRLVFPDGRELEREIDVNPAHPFFSFR